MKIAIVGTSPGNSFGGTEVLVEKLISILESASHQIQTVYLDAKFSNPTEILESITKFKDLDLSAFDAVITLRFPSYYVSHPNKVVWLLHQFRPLGDMYMTEFGFGYSIENMNTRNQLRKMDQVALGKLGNNLRVNSQITAKRLLFSTGIHASIQMCPLSQNLSYDFELKCPKELSDFQDQYIFMGGRISSEKRTLLALQVAQKANVPLVIAGSVEDSDYLSLLQKNCNNNNVKILGRRVTTSELNWLYANSTAVVYIPKGEDSYGFVLGEAASFGKMLITCDDSGDTVPFVKHVMGEISAPDVDSLSRTFLKVQSLVISSDEVILAWNSFEPHWDHVLAWVESCIA